MFGNVEYFSYLCIVKIKGIGAVRNATNSARFTAETTGRSDRVEIFQFVVFNLNLNKIMFQINSNFSISRLNNPEITAFFMNVQKAVSNNDATSSNINPPVIRASLA